MVEMDAVQKLMGAYGKYQLGVTILMFAAKYSIAFNQIAIVFLAPKVSFKCNNVPMKCPCSNPDYDKSVFTNTIVMKWNLICDKKWLVSLSQALFQLGTLFGSILYGMASDRFGRKKPLLVSVTKQIIAGIWAAYASNFWLFTFLRFLVGTSVGGNMVMTFVIMVEFTGAKHRELLSALYQLPFNTGHMLLPVISYFFRDCEDFAMALTVASIILLSYFVLVRETPRWLLAARKTDKAVQCITRVATVNKLPTENIRSQIEEYQAEMLTKHLKKSTIFDVFRSPKLRKNIICMSLNWLTCAYCFYGMSQYVGQLHGDVFINVFASASFAFLGTLLSIPLMQMMGRKRILITINIVTALCLILLAFSKNALLSVILAVIGVMASFIMFIVVYPYCGEMFPTVVRNAAVGYCSMIARVGSMIAPFIIDTKDVATWLPPILFAVCPCIAVALTLLMPETKGRELLNTLEEAEEFENRNRNTNVTGNVGEVEQNREEEERKRV